MATDFNYANTITAATPAVAAEVQDNFDDVLTWVKAYYQQTLDTTTEIAAAIAAIPDDPEEAGQEFARDWLSALGSATLLTSTPLNTGWNYEFQIPAGDDRTWEFGIMYSISVYISGGTPATNNTCNAQVLVNGTNPILGGYGAAFGGQQGDWGTITGVWGQQATGAGTSVTVEVEVYDNFNTGRFRVDNNGSWVRVFAYPQHSLVNTINGPIISYTP